MSNTRALDWSLCFVFLFHAIEFIEQELVCNSQIYMFCGLHLCIALESVT
jgi:hypothetical protein